MDENGANRLELGVPSFLQKPSASFCHQESGYDRMFPGLNNVE